MSIDDRKSDPFRPPQAASGVRLWSPQSLIWGVILIVVFGIVASPFGYVAVSDGWYDLSMTISSTAQIDSASLLFADCWTKQEAGEAISRGTNGSVSFRTGSIVAENVYVISVPYSGRTNYFGFETSFNQPQFLVVQYNLAGEEGKTVRRQFSIPQLRGNRSMTLSLP